MSFEQWRRTSALSAILLVSIGVSLAPSALAARQQTPPQVMARSIQPASIDWSAVGQARHRDAGGVYRIGMPPTDLKVTVEGVPVQAGFALGSYAAFKPMDDGSTMVMGDLVLLHEEVPADPQANGA